MTDKGLRVIGYLMSSQKPWKPDQLVIPPWETGLTSRVVTRRIIRETTMALQRFKHDTR